MHGRKLDLCVTAIIKNEASYIEEWLCYHREIGVEHFFIFDNNSDDGVLSVLERYINHGLVTLIHWPLKGAQVEAYNHALHAFGRSTEWMAFIDLDEFIVLKDHDTVPQLLAALKGADQLLIPWRVFFSGGHRTRPPGLVIENYLHPEEIPEGGLSRIHAKGIVRTAVAESTTAHFSFTTTGATVDEHNRRVPEDYELVRPTFDRVQLNHYWTKSDEEFQAKIRRGQGSGGAEKTYFPTSHQPPAIQDLSALRYLEATRQRMLLMKSLSPTPFRFGSQMSPNGPPFRDPFMWWASLTLAQYSADTPRLGLAAPIAFDNIARDHNTMVARASDFGRPPSRGGLLNSIHTRDLIRRFGGSLLFDIATGDELPLIVSDPNSLSRTSDAWVLTSSSGETAMSAPTNLDLQSRCYCIGFGVRIHMPLSMEASARSPHDDRPSAVKTVELPTAGYYCGLIELNLRPIPANRLNVVFKSAQGKVEIFDLFAIVYG